MGQATLRMQCFCLMMALYASGTLVVCILASSRLCSMFCLWLILVIDDDVPGVSKRSTSLLPLLLLLRGDDLIYRHISAQNIHGQTFFFAHCAREADSENSDHGVFIRVSPSLYKIFAHNQMRFLHSDLK